MGFGVLMKLQTPMLLYGTIPRVSGSGSISSFPVKVEVVRMPACEVSMERSSDIYHDAI